MLSLQPNSRLEAVQRRHNFYVDDEKSSGKGEAHGQHNFHLMTAIRTVKAVNGVQNEVHEVMLW